MILSSQFTIIRSVLWHCWLGDRNCQEGHSACKNLASATPIGSYLTDLQGTRPTLEWPTEK